MTDVKSALSLLATAADSQVMAIDPGQVPPRTLAGGAGVIIVGLLLLLYLHRQRTYILYWIGGWGCFAASMFAVSEGANARFNAAVYGFSQFLSIASALFFVFAADSYSTRRRLRFGQLSALFPVSLWFLLAPIALGPASVSAPGHLIAAIVLTVASGAHLAILRDTKLLGAGLVGVMLLLTSLTNVWMALTPRPAVPSEAFLLELALYFVLALGMQLMTFEDMTFELRRANGRLEAAQSELRQMVVTDVLTGCRNRRFFDEVITHELNNHRRYSTPLSLLFVDVDHFKTINDTLGHATGDRILREVAGFLMRKTRDADYVFRWGGDEFLLLLSCREDEAVRRAVMLQQEFARSLATATLPPGVGLSCGCAEVSENVESVFEALKLADERMYANKRSARLPDIRAG